MITLDYPEASRQKVRIEQCLMGEGVPVDSGIYFVWEGDTVAYVGQSTNLNGRIRHNHGTIYAGDEISWLVFPIEDLDYIECFYIAAYRPWRNFGGVSYRIETTSWRPIFPPDPPYRRKQIRTTNIVIDLDKLLTEIVPYREKRIHRSPKKVSRECSRCHKPYTGIAGRGVCRKCRSSSSLQDLVNRICL